MWMAHVWHVTYLVFVVMLNGVHMKAQCTGILCLEVLYTGADVSEQSSATIFMVAYTLLFREVDAVDSSEFLIHIYPTTRRHIPEDRNV
jgi:hypothetical protein